MGRLKNRLLLLIIACIASQISLGKDGFSETVNEVEPDSMSLVRLDEVMVTGTRAETNLRNLPMSITVVGRDQIENRFEQSLLPVITEEVPGLFITSRGIMGYGVSTGAAGGMTIRGIGGTPTTGVLMLIDGHPQYMGIMGHPLADSYQSMMADKVEVVRGPASVLYGSNATGGVINIITRKQEDGVKTRLRAMYGSYNTLSSEVSNAVRSGRFSSYASLNLNRTDGHRSNMDFRQYSGYAKVGYDFTNNWKAFADFNLSKFEASNPGTVESPVIDNDADITRGMTSFSLENKYNRTSGALKFFYNFGTHKINDGYAIGGTPRNNRFRSKDDLFGVLFYQTYSFFEGNQVTMGFDYQRSEGHAWNKYMNGDPDTDLVDKGINDIAGYVSFQQTIIPRLTLNAGIRLDYNTHAGTEWIPQAGLSFAASDATILKAIVSKGFRNPTIRELYMFQQRNPELKAENLINYEFSVSQGLLNNSLNLGLNLYYIKGDNTIIAYNNKYENTGEIENCGVEFDARYRINTNLSLSANYSFLHMEKKVVASPQHKLYMGAAYSEKKWMISSGIQYVAGLYTMVSLTEDAKDSFLLWNLRGAYRPTGILEIFVKGENLLAQEYEINKGYPMPRATVFGGINLTF